MNQETQVIRHEPVGAALAHRTATDVAGAIREFAIKRCVVIQGKKYPPVEVWQAVANGFGCVASAGSVEEIKGGIRAIGEVRRVSDGHVIATGEGFVGDDEPTWAKRPMFARRAMAQTRSISRACRAAFAFVVPMIDSGLATTPAEEMEGVVDVDATASHASPEPSRLAPRQSTAASISTDVGAGEIMFTDRLVEVKERSGTSARGGWKAWFLRFENREEEAGTFSETIGNTLPALQGATVEAKIRPGKKPGTWGLVSIQPADDVPM